MPRRNVNTYTAPSVSGLCYNVTCYNYNPRSPRKSLWPYKHRSRECLYVYQSSVSFPGSPAGSIKGHTSWDKWEKHSKGKNLTERRKSREKGKKTFLLPAEFIPHPQNKAGYTATLVTCGWSGAVLEKVTGVSGQEPYAQKPQKCQKSKKGTNRPTNRPTDIAGCRVA